MASVLRSRTVEKIDLSNGRDYGRSSAERKVLRCPRICIGGMKENRPVVTAEEVGVVRVDDEDLPVIRLNLKKPRHWNWKLTTSASTPAMILPVVRLVDDNGNVLHDGVNMNKCVSATSSELSGNEGERKSHRRGNCREVRRDVSAGDVLDDLLLGRTATEVSSREVPGSRGNKTDRSHGTRWQNRKQDSGYKSLRKPRERVEETSRRRTASTAQSDEERLRRKRRHRKITVVGDRLLAVNGNDVCFSDQDVDLLRDAPDVVRLQLARRRDDVAGTASRRRLGAMGANVSRHSEKGLTGRRSQSSGNLCNGNKLLARDVGRILTTCNAGPKDRHRLCGSLPNHLDGDNDLDSESNNNNGYLVPIRMNGNVATDGVQLKMAPQQEALHDQGYGSERSPEDEHLPPLPDPEPDQFWSLAQHYPFITPDACFEACLLKGNRGLGLSVTGGADTDEQWPGLIRIKRLFPHQPAWQSGQLCVGDILLATNGVPLTGLTNYQALEVLRTTPNNVILAVCRPPSNVFSLPPPSEPPPPPRRDPALSISSSRILVPLPLVISEEPYGEFDITLTKVNRSLGFTLRKEDESVLGHYVRALVREPALSDGRIRPGDKIVAVNDMPMSPLSHEEAVAFLRQCSDEVRLRLYRDAAQTPVAALSPSEEAPPKPRPALRQEAQDMLTDLAVRKLSPGNSSGSRLSEDHSPAASPRRRRLTKTPSPDILAVVQDRLGQRYLAPSPAADSDNSREQSLSSTFVLSSSDPADPDGSKLQRPKFLDLCGDGATSPKHKYTFSTSEELPGEPASLPPLPSAAFSYSNPAYQSASPAVGKMEEEDPDVGDKVDADGTRGLLKWKGVQFSQTEGEDVTTASNEQVLSVELNRGWNSRLGFSLQNDGSHTYISAIYSDSVAAKDGRLRPNDQLITVNDESVQDMSTTDIIDLLRKIRGTIEIRVLRKSGPNPQIS